MNYSDTVYGYATQALKNADTIIIATLLFSISLLYILRFSARTKRAIETGIQSELEELEAILQQLETLEPLRKYFEAPVDLNHPKNYAYWTTGFMTRYAIFRLENMLELPHVQGLQLSARAFFTDTVKPVRDKLFLQCLVTRPVVAQNESGKIEFNDLSVSEIRKLSDHRINDTMELYNQSAAIIEALKGDDPNLLSINYRQKLKNFNQNLPLSDTWNFSLDRVTQTALEKMRSNNLSSINALNDRISSLTAKKEKTRSELDEAVTMPLLGNAISYRTLIWAVPLVILIAGFLLHGHIQYAHELIHSLPSQDGRYAEMIAQYPWYLTKGIGESPAPFFFLKVLSLFIPLATALYALLHSAAESALISRLAGFVFLAVIAWNAWAIARLVSQPW